MNLREKLIFGAMLASVSAPALAGKINPVPAPAAGIGIGAVVLLGIGYRALKKRINP